MSPPELSETLRGAICCTLREVCRDIRFAVEHGTLHDRFPDVLLMWYSIIGFAKIDAFICPNTSYLGTEKQSQLSKTMNRTIHAKLITPHTSMTHKHAQLLLSFTNPFSLPCSLLYHPFPHVLNPNNHSFQSPRPPSSRSHTQSHNENKSSAPQTQTHSPSLSSSCL